MSEEQQKDACAECEKHLAGWKRALADYDNLKKDLARLRTETREQSRIEVIAQLLPVLDHFDQAVAHAPDGEYAQWMKGILHIRREFEDVIRGFGAEPFGEIGEPFNPDRHETVGSQEDKEKFPHTILEMRRRGWKLNDKIIQPAKVIISCHPEEA